VTRAIVLSGKSWEIAFFSISATRACGIVAGRTKFEDDPDKKVG
jgi:hypothetical protein